MRRKKSLSDVERVLHEHVAVSQFQSLVRAGCDRSRLLALLDWAFLTDESWTKLVGMALRAFNVSIEQIEHCANVISRLNRSDLLYRLSMELHDPRFSTIHQTPTLPDQLRDYAKALKSLPRAFGPKHNITKNVWKAQVVALVMDDTGKPHDLEVSSLIIAILNDPKYSQTAHKQWRQTHSEVIARERTRLRERREQRISPIPQPAD